MSAQIIVSAMCLDRWLVLSFPYEYLRFATDKTVNRVCIGVIVGSFLQYVAYRGLACYAFNKFLSCASNFIYYGILALLTAALSIFSHVKVFMIIRSTSPGQTLVPTLRQYKGTFISFVCLVNQIVTLVINVLLLVVYYFVIVKTGNDGNGQLAQIIAYCYLLSCIIDPFIYVVWLRETRLELLKMVQVIFPYFSKTIEDMRIEIFNIITVTNRYDDNLRSVQEDKIYKTPLDQARKGENMHNAPLKQAVQEEHMLSAHLNRVVQTYA